MTANKAPEDKSGSPSIEAATATARAEGEAAGAAAERARLSEILHAPELAPFARRIIGACRLAIGAPSMPRAEVIAFVETHVPERGEGVERFEAQTRRTLAELAGLDAVADALGIVGARLMAMPDKLDLAPEAHAALVAEISDTLAFATFTLEKAVLDLKDQLEQRKWPKS